MARLCRLNYWTLAVCLQCLQAISSGVVGEDVNPVRFTYDDGPTGPGNWSQLNDEWEKCGTGNQQSPIRITPNIMVIDPELGDLDASYGKEPTPANISINEGYAIEMAVNSSVGLLKIDDVIYRPAQFHFHMGSEHKILGYKFPMELHQVYRSADDTKAAVIAWLFVKGADNEFLAQFEDNLPSPSKSTEFILDPNHLPKIQKSYARYQGSLTTPPCKEGITWTVMLWNFPTISERQIEKFRKVMPIENVRPSIPSRGQRKFKMHL